MCDPDTVPISYLILFISMANKKISELESRASLSLSDLMAVGDPSTGYLYKTTISDLKTLTGAGVVSFNGRFGTVNPAEGDYTLTQLGDVIITSAANGDVLKYNGSNWVNTQLYSGTVAQYIDGTGAYQTFPTLLSSDRLVTNVRNTSGATITKGTVVYLNGSSGTLPTIAKAQANAESTSTGTYGVVQDNIANNANGYVVVIGNLTALDTSAYNAGDILWLSPTVAGGYTTTKPVAPNHAVYVGIVTRSSNTQGTIEVKIQNGYELDELHNVLITSVANNDVLVYETASSLWKNKAFSTLETDTLDSVTGRGNTTANSITVGSVTAAGLSNLLGQIKTFVSTGNTYIGASPASATDAGYKLDVNGTVRISNDLTMWDDGANNGNSRALILRALGSTGNVQTGQIILDGFGAAGQDQLQLSASNIRLSPTTGSVTITGTTPNISTVAASGFRLTANSTTNGFTFTQSYNQTSGDLLAIFTNSNQKKFSVSHAGIVTVADLSGTGSRMVVADANGVLSTQAIPSTSGFVTLDTTQTITGAKTFSALLTTGNIKATYLGFPDVNGYSTGIESASDRTLQFKIGSGIAVNIATTNDATFYGKIIKSGGTSGEFLKADGSVDSNTYLTSGSVSGVYLPLSGGTLTGALNGTTASFSGSVTAYGNAASSSAFNAYNSSGISGIAQYYQDFGNGAGFVAGRILRGNGASGLEANGLNIDNHTGFKVRLNQLGGSGGVFTIDGGNVAINTTSAPERLTVAGAIMSTGAITGHGANRTTLSQEGLNGAYWQSYGANTSTVGTFVLRQASSDFSITRTPLTIDATGAATFSGNVNITVANTPEVFLTHSSTSKTFLMAVDGGNAFFRANSTNNILFQVAGGTTALTIASNQSATFSSSVAAGALISDGILRVSGYNISGDFGANYSISTGIGASGAVARGINIGWNLPDDIAFIGPVHNGQAWKSLALVPVSGSVGVGTTTPIAKLHVNGEIRTIAPTGGTAQNWKLGSVYTGTCVPSVGNGFTSWFTGTVIEVEIAGVKYRIPAVIDNYC
jgi:hypothetical protein